MDIYVNIQCGPSVPLVNKNCTFEGLYYSARTYNNIAELMPNTELDSGSKAKYITFVDCYVQLSLI